MKKILFIGMSPNRGGIETYMMNVFMRLEGHGFHFDFINTSEKPLAYQDNILRNNGNIKNVYMGNSLMDHMFWYKKALNFFRYNNNYDIVYLNCVSLPKLFWIKAANKNGIKKLIIHSHNNGIIYNSLLKSFLASIVNLINRLYLKTHRNIDELAASYDCGKWMFHNNNFKIIPNGINTNKFKFNLYIKKNLKKKLQISNNDYIVMVIARLENQKNPVRIIDIFYYIHKLQHNTKLVIVGDGSKKGSMMSEVVKFHLNNCVIFLGVINNVNDILNIADLILMPSKYEGAPFSLIECQSSGVPAIVSSNLMPNSINVTDKILFYSLANNNKKWAQKSIYIMKKNSNTVNCKVKMNLEMSHSKYNKNKSIKILRKLIN